MLIARFKNFKSFCLRSFAVGMFFSITISGKGVQAQSFDPVQALFENSVISSFAREKYAACPKIGSYKNTSAAQGDVQVTAIFSKKPFDQFLYYRYFDAINSNKGIGVYALYNTTSKALMIQKCDQVMPMGIYFNSFYDFKKVCPKSNSCLNFEQALALAEKQTDSSKKLSFHADGVKIYQPLRPKSQLMYEFTGYFGNSRDQLASVSVSFKGDVYFF